MGCDIIIGGLPNVTVCDRGGKMKKKEEEIYLPRTITI